MNTTTTETTTRTTTDATTTDPRPLFARAVEIATPIIDAVTPDQFGLTTPCSQFNVEQLLGHLVFVLHRVAAVGRGEHTGLTDETVTSTDWSADWRAAGDAVAAVWADSELLTTEIVLPWARMSGAEALGTYTSEITSHTWDLARATGQQPAWDDEVCRLGLASMRRELPMADRTEIWKAFAANVPADMTFDAPFGNAVDVAADAPMIDQLVAWTGRQP
jgi:uncharacterized protein (TIGR03086 family)